MATTPVTFRTALAVTVDDASTSDTVIVSTGGGAAGDIIVIIVSTINVVQISAHDTSSIGIPNELAPFGGNHGGQVFVYLFDGVAADYRFDGLGTIRPFDFPAGSANRSVAAAACAYTPATMRDYGITDVRLPVSSVTTPLLTPGTALDCLVTGQVLPSNNDAFGDVDPPFTLRASMVGRLSPVDNRYAMAQLGDYEAPGGATQATWTNTDSGVISPSDMFDGLFVFDGVGVFIADLVPALSVPSGLHVWQRI